MSWFSLHTIATSGISGLKKVTGVKIGNTDIIASYC